jgi:all-trans-retinol 13,14-reductase
MKYDIIIIGGGLGGLTAGAKLSKEGKKVLLIEKHKKPGGCATTFRRRDFILEVGLHELHGPAPGDLKMKIFDELDVFSHVKFIKIPEFYRFINGRSDVTIPHDPVSAAELLTTCFPHEADGIMAYFDQLMKPKKKPAGEQVPDGSIGDFLDSIIKDEELKLILLGNLGYYNDDPYSLSLAYYSQAQGSYYSAGASFIKGGSQVLSDYLSGYICAHGGEVILNHRVTSIFSDNGRLAGVNYILKNDPSGEVMSAFANEIIAGSSVPGLVDLLPHDEALKLSSELKGLSPGPSLLTLYLGFSKPLKELGWNNYSAFIFDSTVRTQADIVKNNHAAFAERLFTFVDYGQIESGLAPEGKSVGAVCCIDYIKDWEILTKEEYNKKKELAATELTGRLEQLIPGIKGIIEYREVATPMTVKRYTLNDEGAVYGFAQVPARKSMDLSKLPDNLHFASAWGRTGGGFSGAIFGGYLCAINILRKRQAASQ